MRRTNDRSRLGRALMAAVCLTAGCRPVDDAETPAAQATPEPVQAPASKVRTAYARIGPRGEPRKVKYEVVDGMAIFEGDIILGTAEQVERESESLRAQAEGRVSAQGLIVTPTSKRWPNGVVPYVHVYGSLYDNYVVADAMRHWERQTGLRFSPVSASTPTSTPHVYFTKGTVCSSAVGMQGDRQFIILAEGCGFGSVVHELGHAIGLWHEQSRADRDQYVDILWDNILDGSEHNFEQHISDGDDEGPYDFNSIMHYGSTSFGKTDPVTGAKLTTIRTKNGESIGQRSGLSPGDVAAAAKMYPGVVKGYFEEITPTGQVKGWALDTASPGVSIDVHYYIDGPAGSGAYSGAAATDVYRSDVNDAFNGIVGDHGFYFPVPAYFRDGQPHTMYVYGIDAQGLHNPLLDGSARTFNLPGAFGTLDSIGGDGVVTGWALDLDSPSASINVYYSIDGNPATAATITANLYRGDVNAAYPGTTGNHGFSFRLPDSYVDGQEHTLQVFALDAQGRNSPLLNGAPRTFRLAMPIVYQAGDFIGSGTEQLLAIFGGGTGRRVNAYDYRFKNGAYDLRYQENWGDSGVMDGWHEPSDVKLKGDFRGLGYDQLLFINNSGWGGRVMITDFRDGVVPVEVRYHEPYGQSDILNGWQGPEDLQLVGDFLGRGHDQVMFINRDGVGGRVMIADFSDGAAPVEVGYLESWSSLPDTLQGWIDPNDQLLVGDFQNRGYDQVLCINRAGTQGRVQVLDFRDGVAPAEVRYSEQTGAFPQLDGLTDDGDAGFVGDFRGLGYDQLLLVNNGTTGPRLLVADFLDGVPPAEVRYREEIGDGYVLYNLTTTAFVGDFRALGHDQLLYGSPYLGTHRYTRIVDFSDGVAPTEVLYNQIEMN
ncbi:M12 family metallopeptidase [Myxococcus sp. RHSTA-1-4]|uniref:M12 family metallopeptidase n=1 Tax=Myxococcus sp. RHSTA-1-4 TaxID=2874601 RepID=UPI001CC133AF|nr:M12 family metallopeptidase [Myxococcus sp. RHSTA-1-4]MBZ4416670.1 M12 family metallopeptidase [Myxococcus sp. RHSTA-1-4]